MNFNNAISKSFATVRQMLTDRGVNTESLDRFSNDDLVAVSASRNVFHIDLTSCGYRVIYNMNVKFKSADIRKLLDYNGAQVFMVITRDKPTHPGRKGTVDELDKDVQFFDIDELMFNVSQHQDVPLHEPIRDEAAIEDIIKRYSMKSRFQLPLILSTDAMARYLALKHGQLVRITRPSPSAGSYVSYRCCMRAV